MTGAEKLSQLRVKTRVYVKTVNRSESGASKFRGYGEMSGAKIPMTANTSTIVSPNSPRRLPLNRAKESWRVRLNALRKRIASSLTDVVDFSDADTRI